MSARPAEPIRLLTIADVLAASERILAAPRSNAVRVSLNEIVSFAVLAGQLDAIVKKAADLVVTGDRRTAAARLRALEAALAESGYLATTPSQDRTAHG